MRYLNHLIIFSLLVSTVALSGCSAARSAFSQGEQFEAKGDYEDAMYSYAEAFRNDPDTGEYRARFFKARETAANLRYQKGLDQYERGDYVGAVAEFQTAYGLDPTQDRYKQKAEETVRLRDAQLAYNEGLEFEKANKFKDANRSYLVAIELHPENKVYQEALNRINRLRKSKLEGFELSLKSAKPITLKFKDAKIKDVFKIITQLTGINFIFDEAVKDHPISIYLENATFQQAMDLLTNMNKLDKKVLNESTVLIFPRTPDKAKQYDDLTLRTYHLSYMDAKKAVNLVRTMLQVKKIYVNEESNSLIVRDTSDVVAVVEKILEANDVPDPEVVLEVEVMEITDHNAENLGLLLSNYNVQLGAFNGSTPLSSSLSTVTTTPVAGVTTTSTAPAEIASLVKAFSMGGYGGFVTVPTAQYNFGKTLTKGEVLSNPKIRVRNKEKAKFNVGQRVPITTTTLNGTLSQVNVQYVDVGVKLNAEPTIQLNNEIIIKLSLEVSSILSKEIVGGSSSPTSVVTIGTRNLDTVLSLKDGETSIIGGLIQNTKNNTKQKIYLLSDIPLIGPLLTNHDTTKDKTELILAITPRLVRSVTVPQSSLMSFATGKEDDPSLMRPMASFDQEPIFKGEAAPSPAENQVKPTLPAAVPNPAAPGATKPVPVETPAAAASTPPVTATPVVPPPVKRGLVQIAAPAGIDVGQQFYVDIKASDVQDMAGATLVLSYDPKFVEYVSTTEGVFLKKDGKPTTFSSTANPAEGTLTILMSRAPNSGGMTGAGTIASALFRAKGKGGASFGFQSVNFTSADGKQLEMLPFSTAVNVR
ncbi:MAG: cohesin domain-containing protein [Desulfobacteraceae bacterium]|nr:cohesin domain-containing protein [Desulfobacteraceae bacterium]